MYERAPHGINTTARAHLTIKEVTIYPHPLPCLLPPQQTCEHRAVGVEARSDIGGCDADFTGWTVGLAGDTHEAGLGFDDHIVPRCFPVRARLSVSYTYIPTSARTHAAEGSERTRDRGINQPRIDLLTVLVPQPHTLQFPRDKVLDEDVGLADELLDYLEAFGFFEVDGDGAFVSVDGEEVRGLRGEVGGVGGSVGEEGGGGWVPISCVVFGVSKPLGVRCREDLRVSSPRVTSSILITSVRRVEKHDHLHHISDGRTCAQITQKHSRRRSSQYSRQVHDLYARKRQDLSWGCRFIPA